MVIINNNINLYKSSQNLDTPNFEKFVNQVNAQNISLEPGKPFKSGILIRERAGIDADLDGISDNIFVVGNGDKSSVYLLKDNCKWVKLEGVKIEQNLPSTYIYSDGTPEYDEMKALNKPGLLSYTISFSAHVALHENNKKPRTADSTVDKIILRLPMYEYESVYNRDDDDEAVFIQVKKDSPDARNKIVPQIPRQILSNDDVIIKINSADRSNLTFEMPFYTFMYHNVMKQEKIDDGGFQYIITLSEQDTYERIKMMNDLFKKNLNDQVVVNTTIPHVPDSDGYYLLRQNHTIYSDVYNHVGKTAFSDGLSIDEFPPCGKKLGQDIEQFQAVHELDRYNVRTISSTAIDKKVDKLQYGFTEMGGCKVWYVDQDGNKNTCNVVIRNEQDKNGKDTGLKIASFPADTKLTAQNINFDGKADIVEIRWNPAQPNDEKQISISTRFEGSTNSYDMIAKNTTLLDYDGDGKQDTRKTYDISQANAQFNTDPNSKNGEEFEYIPKKINQNNIRIILQHTNIGKIVE